MPLFGAANILRVLTMKRLQKNSGKSVISLPLFGLLQLFSFGMDKLEFPIKSIQFHTNSALTFQFQDLSKYY